ncbi:MAG: hypothetical protein KGO52_01900 [Nitrospirota bacterium]|nr:hypothetical protein [Nitrospirota bacterium]MDE3241454.1 hypothetical protein [Nitrospirota bacterium]
MQQPAPLLAGFLFILTLSAPASAGSDRAASDASLAGTWACQSVYGGPFTGRACHTWPQLMLRDDGTYTWGSEQGTWEVQEHQLHLSGRTGTGHLDVNGKLIVEYEVKGTKYRQTLFRR